MVKRLKCKGEDCANGSVGNDENANDDDDEEGGGGGGDGGRGGGGCTLIDVENSAPSFS